jgi:hypothetical protein
LHDRRPGLVDVPLEDLIGIDMAAPTLGLEVRDVGIQQLGQGARRLLDFGHLLGEKGLALLDLGFAQAAAVGASGVDLGQRPALFQRRGDAVAPRGRLQLLRRRRRVVDPDRLGSRLVLPANEYRQYSCTVPLLSLRACSAPPRSSRLCKVTKTPLCSDLSAAAAPEV